MSTMNPTPDTPQERDNKAEDLARATSEVAEVKKVEEQALAAQIARDLARFRMETRILYTIVILILVFTR